MKTGPTHHPACKRTVAIVAGTCVSALFPSKVGPQLRDAGRPITRKQLVVLSHPDLMNLLRLVGSPDLTVWLLVLRCAALCALNGVRCALCVACCALCAACCMLRAGCWVLCAVRLAPCAVCRVLCAVCCVLCRFVLVMSYHAMACYGMSLMCRWDKTAARGATRPELGRAGGRAGGPGGPHLPKLRTAWDAVPHRYVGCSASDCVYCCMVIP